MIWFLFESLDTEITRRWFPFFFSHVPLFLISSPCGRKLHFSYWDDFSFYVLIYSTVSLETWHLYLSVVFSWTSLFLQQSVIVIMILDTEKHIIKLHFSSVRLSSHHVCILHHELIKYLDLKLTLIKCLVFLPDFTTFFLIHKDPLSILKFPSRDYNKDF